MQPPEPILVTHLFGDLHLALLELLNGLSPDDWQQPIVLSTWTVKEVALHLLGGDIGILSRRRDGFIEDSPGVASFGGLVAFINERNEIWLKATRRLSTRVLCDLMAITGTQLADYFATVDPFAMGNRVSWAGPEPAPVWLDLAREFTERWYHQQQIRDAVSRPGMKQTIYFAPVLDAFVRALPYTLRDVNAPVGSQLMLTITGDAGSSWVAVKENERWNLYVAPGFEPDARINARVTVPEDIAWRIFTRGIDRAEALVQSQIEGTESLAQKIFDMVSIIA